MSMSKEGIEKRWTDFCCRVEEASLSTGVSHRQNTHHRGFSFVLFLFLCCVVLFYFFL